MWRYVNEPRSRGHVHSSHKSRLAMMFDHCTLLFLFSSAATVQAEQSASGGSGGSGLGGSGSGSGAETPIHILFILVDDLGWFDVGWNGAEIKTPVLDQLAREG